MEGKRLAPAPLPLPAGFRLTSEFDPVMRSNRKTSDAPLVSLATRLAAVLSNTTQRPFVESIGEVDAPIAAVQRLSSRLTNTVVPATTSRRNTSLRPLVSFRARLPAALWNATKRPSAETV